MFGQSQPRLIPEKISQLPPNPITSNEGQKKFVLFVKNYLKNFFIHHLSIEISLSLTKFLYLIIVKIALGVSRLIDLAMDIA